MTVVAVDERSIRRVTEHVVAEGVQVAESVVLVVDFGVVAETVTVGTETGRVSRVTVAVTVPIPSVKVAGDGAVAAAAADAGLGHTVSVVDVMVGLSLAVPTLTLTV